GYTDRTGTQDLNMRLSQQRAYSVATSLNTHGVEPNPIRTSGLGPAMPIATNTPAYGKGHKRGC
ncbi:OmpA family protein, partial [Enterobacter hormaechei]